MATRVTLKHLGREWLVGLMSYALLVAPFGCQFQTDLLDLGGDLFNPGGSSTDNQLTTSSAGLFFNSDTTSPLIVAGRSASGDAFFVYGTRTSSGGLKEVQSILVQTAAGEKSSIVFESGRPAYLKGPDGSYVRIVYTEVSSTRLAATVTVHDAKAGTTETTDTEIDLAEIQADLTNAADQAADSIASLSADFTDQQVEVTQLPAGATGKWQDRGLSTLLFSFAIVPLVFVSQYMFAIMGQLMVAMFAAVAVTMQAAIVAAFMPMFLFSSLLSETLVMVQMVPLFDVFLMLPSAPTIDIVID